MSKLSDDGKVFSQTIDELKREQAGLFQLRKIISRLNAEGFVEAIDRIYAFA